MSLAKKAVTEAALKQEIKELRSVVDRQAKTIAAHRAANFKLALKGRKRAKGSQYCRVAIPDSHGSGIDQAAAGALLDDLEIIKPAEIVWLGDHINCGGFLAQHHTIGYVAETSYTFEEDVQAANQFIDAVQQRTGKAEHHYIEGNHERRIEAWCVTQALKNREDAKYLLSMFSANVQLNIEKRGMRWIKQGEYYDGVPLPSTIKLGNCYFTHGSSTAKHAAHAHLQKFGGNIVYGHCFSEDTELLTREGWKPFADVRVGDTAGTMNLHDASFEWNVVSDVFKHSHFNELIRFKTPSVDAMVTPDHAMVTVSRKSRNIGETVARKTLRRQKAADLATKVFSMPHAAINKQPDYPIDPDVLRFYAWVITEGSISDQGKGGHIRIAQSDNPVKGGMQSLEGVLDRLKVQHSKVLRYKAETTTHGQHRAYDAYRFNISRKDKICDMFAKDCPGKTLQSWMLKLSARQAEILFEVLILADGCKNKSALNSFQYATKHVAERDILQAICATNGWRCTWIKRNRRGSTYYCMTINKRGLSHVHSKPELVQYTGDVYCCSVENQSLIVRRNGKSFVSGNTHRMDSHFSKTVKAGRIGAWSPGCLCKYNHCGCTQIQLTGPMAMACN